MSKEDYIYKNFVFEDSAKDGKATYQSDCKKYLLETQEGWQFLDETITTKGDTLVAILKMRKKKIFFKLEEIEYFFKKVKWLNMEGVNIVSKRDKDFNEFKKFCDIKKWRKYLEEDAEELLYRAAYYEHKLHKIVEKYNNIKRNLNIKYLDHLC
tara:strand:+ start:3593 stop:4054 length:462 start_codon:yes stop_codon:yes gene_type:complete